MIEHENELKFLTTSELSSKNKEKVKENDWDISLKTLPSKTNKVDDNSDSSDEGSSKDEEIRLFVKYYNQI